MDKTYCAENLYFWMEVEIFRKIKDPEILKVTPSIKRFLNEKETK
jgi:hypothetical protein